MDAAPTKRTLVRLARDVRALQGDTLAEHGVYYRHSPTDVLRGQAVITGAPDAVYAGGCYVFDFVFPRDYPHRPPVATFRTVDHSHRTRFNPNCYRNGKVCLSVLNTWQGDQWTGCQTISSVLLAIKANVFSVAEPILNEPGVRKQHPDFDTYHSIVRFKNLQVAVWQTALEVSEARGPVCEELRGAVARSFLDGQDRLVKTLSDAAASIQAHMATTGLYDMKVHIDYQALLADVTNRGPGLRERLQKVAEIDV